MRLSLMILFWQFFSILCSAQGPQFLIIGVQKAGTSSLYSSITQHPQIQKNRYKELHFFNWHFNKGLSWYSRLFPRLLSSGAIVGEASPNYLYTQEAPQRVYEYFPEVKIVILLRNPVQRAVSQYKHAVRMKLENRSFKECIDYEISKYCAGEYVHETSHEKNKDVHKKFAYHPIFSHPNFACSLNSGYVNIGVYIKHIKNWLTWFKREQFLILRFEDLLKTPGVVFRQVFNFLGVQPYHVKLKHVNSSPSVAIEPEALEMLKEFYKPYNDELQQYLGMKFDWF